MKKALSLLCAVMLALMSVSALAAEGDAFLGYKERTYIENIVIQGDTMYLKGNQIYSYHVGDADMKAYEREADFSEVEESGGYVDEYSGILFAENDKLYSINPIQIYGETNRIDGAFLSEVVLTEDGKAKYENSRKVDWPDELIRTYDGSSYAMSVQNVFAQNGVLYFSAYGDQGLQAYSMEWETMKLKPIEISNLQALLPYSDGRVLLQTYRPEGEGGAVVVYDPASGQKQTLFEGDEMLSGLAADPETGMLYCVKGGEICSVDAQTGAIGEALTEMPMSVYSDSAGLIFAGQYYVYQTNDGVIVRNLRPEQRPTRRIKVLDNQWLDCIMDAYFKFTNVNGDVAVAISRDYDEYGKIIENMMNRESDVDIYILSTSDSAYSALMERGYMAELDGSEKLTAATENFYPAIREKIVRDGKLVAIPVGAYCWSMGVNERVLEKIGLTIDDVPTNWVDFLDFLTNELPQHLTKESGVTLLYEDTSANAAREQLSSLIFDGYQLYADSTMDIPSYNTELLRTLLTKINQVDFEALGHETEEENVDRMGGAVVVYSSESNQLFDFNCGASFGSFYPEYTPLLMRMDADAPAILPLSTSVAFVNPFSENVDAAIEFLETLQDCLPQETLYNFDPTLNEPIRRENYEEYLESAQKYYDDVKKQYDEAEPADKQALEEAMKDAEDWLAREEKDSWLISQEQIDWFRSNDDAVMARGVSWIYQDSSGEGYELMQQYMTGMIDVNQFLQEVDKKVRMMQMEGM